MRLRLPTSVRSRSVAGPILSEMPSCTRVSSTEPRAQNRGRMLTPSASQDPLHAPRPTAVRSSCVGPRLHGISVLWFWATISAVFYIGLTHVLPAVYVDFSGGWLLTQHLLCYFMLAQMLLNWALIRLIRSPFEPTDHMDYISAHSDEVANGGFEINLNHLKTADPANSSFSVPMVSVKSVDKKKTWDRDTMYVISLPPEEVGHSYSPDDRRRIVYPYWSWKPCLICQCQRPPRAHHCPLCNVCVLKRDHHCFFTGSCIGLHNQRHFVVFVFWASMATSYCLMHSLVYLCTHFLNRNTVWDLLLPMTAIRWTLGFVGFLDAFMVTTLYSVVWFWITSLGFFIEQIRAIREGATSFELDNKIKISNAASMSERLSGVFGKHWAVNFFVPLHRVFPCTDDGVQWSSIKA